MTAGLGPFHPRAFPTRPRSTCSACRRSGRTRGVVRAASSRLQVSPWQPS